MINILNLFTSEDKLSLLLEQEHNEVFFRKSVNFESLNELDFTVIKEIDNAVPIEGTRQFRTLFGIAELKHLSTGCKTLINILHYPDRAFSLMESGDNVVTLLAELCFRNELDRCVLLSSERRLERDVLLIIDNILINSINSFIAFWYEKKKREFDDEVHTDSN